MPIYEYQCQGCGEETEMIESVSAKTSRKCESCGGKMVRLMSSNAFHLKGGGWYKDGYASKDKKSDAKGKGATAKKETAASAKSEAKKPEKSGKTAAA